MVAALRVIRDGACANIGVEEIAEEVSTSRSVLQRRFCAVLGRTVHDQIVSHRIKGAVELITSTDLPLALIAERCGFHHQEYMGAVFKARLGRSPAQVREIEGRPRSR